MLLLNGSGPRIVRPRDAGLEAEDDQTLIEYALSKSLIVVTFDKDLRDKVRRGGCRCLQVRPPERTARNRMAAAYHEIVSLFGGERMPTVMR